MLYRMTQCKVILLFTFLLLPLSAIAGEYSRGLLWKVESGDSALGNASYILGTMHTEDKRVLEIPGVVKQALQQSASFTMELKMDDSVRVAMIAMMIFDDGHDLKKILGDRLYAQVSELMIDYGVPQMTLRAMKPWAVLLTLSAPKPVTGQFLDKVLLDQAVAQNKHIYGLETVEEQLSVFDSLTIADQTVLLQDTVDYYPELSGIYEEMTNLYLKRDLSGLSEINDKYMRKGNVAVADKLMVRLIDDRNVRMVTRMSKQLEQGSAFIAVGALHLPGKKGVLHLLKQKGYKVSVVY